MINTKFMAAVAGLSISTLSASAGLVTLSMVNGDDGGMTFNTTAFALSNASGPGVDLDTWSMTVGDTTFLYDNIYLSREMFSGGDGTQSAVLTFGDRTDDGLGTDSFAYVFTNFAPGVSFAGQWDIDFDSGAFDVDARTVLFNNGAAPNAVLNFTFSDGSTIVYVFPDLPILDSYTLTIPAPGAATAVALVLGVAAHRRRR
jgi:hypothetical protein